jgi:hypothetical protein
MGRGWPQVEGLVDVAARSECEVKANAFTRQVDELAKVEGCELPATVLLALVRLFGEALEVPWGVGRGWARYEFTRCGAVDDQAEDVRPRCVRRLGHAGRHFAARGEQWGDATRHAERTVEHQRFELLCFSADCDAVATHGRFCVRHS